MSSPTVDMDIAVLAAGLQGRRLGVGRVSDRCHLDTWSSNYISFLEWLWVTGIERKR